MTKETKTIFTRRRILAGLGLGGAAAAAMAAPRLSLNLAGKRAGGSWWNAKPVALGSAGLDQWRAQIGSNFKVEGEGAKLKLVKVQELTSAGRRPAGLGRDRGFVAVFEAQGVAPAGDRTYTLAHASTGKLDIFMNAANAGSATRLEAVFN